MSVSYCCFQLARNMKNILWKKSRTEQNKTRNNIITYQDQFAQFFSPFLTLIQQNDEHSMLMVQSISAFEKVIFIKWRWNVSKKPNLKESGGGRKNKPHRNVIKFEMRLVNVVRKFSLCFSFSSIVGSVWNDYIIIIIIICMNPINICCCLICLLLLIKLTILETKTELCRLIISNYAIVLAAIKFGRVYDFYFACCPAFSLPLFSFGQFSPLFVHFVCVNIFLANEYT